MRPSLYRMADKIYCDDTEDAGKEKNNAELINWCEAETFKPSYVIKPFHIDDLVEAVKLTSASNLELRVRGCGTANPATCRTPHVVVDMTTYNKPIKVDIKNMQVEVETGMTVRQLNTYLQRKGLALPVQGIWQDVTIGGAVVTGTHGTGATYGTVGSYLIGATLVLASGEIKKVSREEEHDILRCIPGCLGMLGILATVTLQCEQMFKLRLMQKTLPFREILESMEKDRSANEHYQFNFCPGVEGAQALYWNRTEEADMIKPPPSILSDVFGAIGGGLAQFGYLLSSLVSPVAHQANRLERFTFFDDDREAIAAGNTLMTVSELPKMTSFEWAIPVDHTKDAIRDISAWISQSKFPVHNAIHARFGAKDDLILSPSYGRDVCWIQILTRRPYGKHIDHSQLHKAMVTVMKRYDGRPNWAECFDEKEAYISFFPEWSKFKEIRRTLDPEELFLNDSLRKIIDF